MQKIKIVGFFIFLLSLVLIIISYYISEQNTLETKVIDTINRQKAFTQEISKNIFYLYKKEQQDNLSLENSIHTFLSQSDSRIDEISFNTTKVQKETITQLWNKFYLLVQKFRENNRVITPYSNIILEKIVNDIYNLNLSLVIKFDTLVTLQQKSFNTQLRTIKEIQYSLFFILLSLLIYLFTQLKTVLSFIQKFLYTSKNILSNSSIKGLEPIHTSKNNFEVSKATNNFNLLVHKIDISLKTSVLSIEETYKSLEEVENNIEDMLELLCQMQECTAVNKELTKKEDAVIESLEELISSRLHLNNLKNDLNNLITHSQLKN